MRVIAFILFILVFGVFSLSGQSSTSYDVEFSRICLIDSIAPDTLTQFWRFTQANNPGGITRDYTYDLAGGYNVSGTVVPCCSCLTAASDKATVEIPGAPGNNWGAIGFLTFISIIPFVLIFLLYMAEMKAARFACTIFFLTLIPVLQGFAQSETLYDVEFTQICLIDSIAPDTIVQFWRFTHANNPGGITRDFTYDLSGAYIPTGTVIGCNDYYLGDKNPPKVEFINLTGLDTISFKSKYWGIYKVDLSTVSLETLVFLNAVNGGQYVVDLDNVTTDTIMWPTDLLDANEDTVGNRIYTSGKILRIYFDGTNYYTDTPTEPQYTPIAQASYFHLWNELSDTAIALTWTTDVSGTYSVERSSDNVTFSQIATTADTTYQDTSIVFGQEYYYRIKQGSSISNSTRKLAWKEINSNARLLFQPASKLQFSKTDSFSVEGWWELDTITTEILTRQSGLPSPSYWQIVNLGGRIRIQIIDSLNNSWRAATSSNINYSSDSLVIGRKNHIVFTYNGSGSGSLTSVRCYINGQWQKLAYDGGDTDKTFTGPFSFSDSLVITYNGYKNKCSGLRIFSKVLSPSEVHTLYNDGRPGNELADIVGNCIFDYQPHTSTWDSGASKWVLADVASDPISGTSRTGGSESDLYPVEAFQWNHTGPYQYVPDLTNGLFDIGKRGQIRSTYNFAGVFRSFPFGTWNQAQQSVFSNGKIYSVGRQGGMHGNAGKMMIWVYDTLSQRVSYPHEVTDTNTLAGYYDFHLWPSVYVAPNGSIITAQEYDHLSGGIVIRKFEADTFRYITTLDGQHYYPHFRSVGSDLFLLSRGPALDRLSIRKSSDNGETWGGSSSVLDIGSSWCYYSTIHDPDEERIFVVVNSRADAPGGGNFEQLFFLQSRDGVSWYNIDSTYTTSSIIDSATLVSHFQHVPKGTAVGVNMTGHTISGDTIYVTYNMLDGGDTTLNVLKLPLGGVSSTLELSVPGWKKVYSANDVRTTVLVPSSSAGEFDIFIQNSDGYTKHSASNYFHTIGVGTNVTPSGYSETGVHTPERLPIGASPLIFSTILESTATFFDNTSIRVVKH